MAAVVIDPTRIAAYIDMNGRWKPADDSYSVLIPVSVGRKYRFVWTDTAADDVGTIFRWGFTSNSTPNSQKLSGWVRTSPQATPSAAFTAATARLVLQLGTQLAGEVFSNGYLTLTPVDERSGAMLERRRILALGSMPTVSP